MAGAKFTCSVFPGAHTSLGGAEDARYQTSKCVNNYISIIVANGVEER